MANQTARLAVIGIHGHGATHVLNAGRVGRLVAVVDPRPPEPSSPAAADEVRWFAELDSLLAADLGLDAVVLCTPLHTHAALTTALLQAGVDFLFSSRRRHTRSLRD